MSRVAAHLLVALLAAVVLPPAARAQEAGRTGGGDETLEGRMKAFSTALYRDFGGTYAEFFPRRGAWTWVHTVHGPDGDRVGFWRFEPADMAKALEPCGPLHPSFNLDHHAQPVGRLVQQLGEAGFGSGLRRAGRSRFVVPPSWAGRAAFVEWRREDGRWVISSVGDESFRGPRPPGREKGMIERDTAAAMSREDAYSTGTSWFDENQTVTFEGHRYIKYGRPRALDRGDLAWIGRIGPVRVYAERGVSEGYEEILYLPTAPGEYQPYETHTRPSRCRR